MHCATGKIADDDDDDDDDAPPLAITVMYRCKMATLPVEWHALTEDANLNLRVFYQTRTSVQDTLNECARANLAQLQRTLAAGAATGAVDVYGVPFVCAERTDPLAWHRSTHTVVLGVSLSAFARALQLTERHLRRSLSQCLSHAGIEVRKVGASALFVQCFATHDDTRFGEDDDDDDDDDDGDGDGSARKRASLFFFSRAWHGERHDVLPAHLLPLLLHATGGGGSVFAPCSSSNDIMHMLCARAFGAGSYASLGAEQRAALRQLSANMHFARMLPQSQRKRRRRQVQ